MIICIFLSQDLCNLSKTSAKTMIATYRRQKKKQIFTTTEIYIKPILKRIKSFKMKQNQNKKKKKKSGIPQNQKCETAVINKANTQEKKEK